MKPYFGLSLLLGMLVILIGGCSNSNTSGDSASATRVHQALFSNPVMQGNAAFHSEQITSSGSDSCTLCHGINLGGSGTVPSCAECHFTAEGGRVPAGSTWTHGSLQHTELLSSGEVCNNCHASYRVNGGGPDNCHDCHIGGTHPLGQAWLDRNSSTFHGAAAVDPVECSACHGSDFKGGVSGVSCYQCHFGPTGTKVPSGKNWEHGISSHSQQTESIANCNTCHDISRLYGNGPSACHDCHVSATHALGQPWLDKKSSSFHGTAAKADINSCALCHGADFLGGSSGVSCSKCHFGPNGTKVPPDKTWEHGISSHNQQTESIANCNTCHDISRLYGNGPSACHDCHVSATHALGQPWLDKKSSSFHGTAAKADINSCALCHGADFLGGSSGVSCSKCHFGPTGSKIPAGQNWVHGSVPHADLTPYEVTCSTCHDLNRIYQNGPDTCHDCHATANHPLGQDWLDSFIIGYHGDAASQNVDSCKPCHGSDFNGGISGISCSQCHFGPTGSKVPQAVSWSHGSTPHGSLTPYIATCNQCHSLNRSYSKPPNACHDCHISATHALGQPWLDKAQPGWHGSVATPQNVDSCKSCHGSDFQGGSSTVSCYQCHFGPTGSKSPAGSGWVHGSSPHSSFAANIAVCNSCHDLNRSYGHTPNSCHDCHASATHALGQPWLDKTQPNWHGVAAEQDLNSCTPCHGNDFQGGISTVSCYQCHFGPNGDKAPDGSWAHGTTPHGSLAATNAVCDACHTLNRSYGLQPNNCHDCHGSGGASHATGASWLLPQNHAQQSIVSRSSCLGCHDYAGSAGQSPSCNTCHTQSNPPTSVGNCTSCHGKPPSTGEHTLHVGELNMNCIDCHSGFGTGTLLHYYPDPSSPADVQFDSDVVPSAFSAIYDGQGNLQSCNGNCHADGESKEHDNKNW